MHPVRMITVLCGGASLLVCITACSSPTRPSVSVASATPFSPANGAQFAYNTQPVKLLAWNAVTTGGVSLSETFDVATDPAFGTLVVSKNVPQAASGQTSLMLDPLPPATYFWRVRAAVSDATVMSPTFTFKVVLLAPVLISPANAVQVSYHAQPVKLVVDNGVATGGVLVGDTFEVATDAAFATLVVSKSLPQSASGQTALMLDPLPPATYYWRVRAAVSDATMTSPTFTFNIAVALPAPVLVSPASGVLIGDLNQPITLVIQNPPSSPPVGGVTNTFEVATDSAFANIEVRRSVPQAAGGLTSLLLDTLTPSASYFWRVKAEASSAIGAVSGTSSFRIGPAIVPGPYRLTVNIPYDYDYGRCTPATGTQYLFDGNLTRNTQTIVFAMPLLYSYRSLTLRVTLAGGRVSGSLVDPWGYPSTRVVRSPCCNFSVWISGTDNDTFGSLPTPVDVSGSVNVAEARVTGSFDGYILAIYTNETQFNCRGTYPWSLTPR
jgi:hypothetical protein